MLLLAITMRTSRLTLAGNITDVEDISINTSGVVFVELLVYIMAMPMLLVGRMLKRCRHH